MRRTLFLSYLILTAFMAAGQHPVTFTLNLAPLSESDFFIPDEQTRVFIRGSFNNWEGTDYELKRKQGESVYHGSFNLQGAHGDTIEYKYIIEKEPGYFFWEKNPNPLNLPYFNRVLVLGKDREMLPEAYFLPDEYFSYPVIFSKEKLQADFLQMRRILEETHPALYDYTDKRVLDSLFDNAYSKINSDLNFTAFLLLATEVISQVGCGHSSMWIPGRFWNVAPDGLFPLDVYVDENRVFVKGFFADTGRLAPGSEILSINGEDVALVVKRLEYLTSSDGLSPAFRRAKVARFFSQKYAVAFGFHPSFQISFKAPGEARIREMELPGVGKDRLDQSQPAGTELSMVELGGEFPGPDHTALLTINTFIYYSRVDMFRSFLDSVFEVIQTRGIDRLILDLRGNGGGDPFCASYLWAILEPEPLPYFEDHYGKYDTLANPVPQALFPYRGKLLTLIDGLCFSTTGHFCGLLKYHRVGEFVGSETGATYTCTGNATYPALDQTGIMAGTARMGRYTAAVKNMNPRRGIIPDYPVKIKPSDLVNQRDPVMEKAFSLLLAQ